MWSKTLIKSLEECVWVGKKLTGNPRDLDTNECLMIFREMLDSLEGWESAWSAPLDNNIAGTQTHPHTMSLQKTESVLFFNLGVEDKVIVQGSRFSKEGNCLWYLPVHAAQKWIGLYSLVCYVLPLVYHEGAKCNLG